MIPRTIRRPLRAAALLLLALPALAATRGDVPIGIQVPLLLRVLSYDRALGRNGGNEVVLAVLYDAASASSTQAKDAFTRTLRSANISSVSGHPLRVVEINAAAGNVAASLRGSHATAAYLTPDMDGRLQPIVRSASDARVLLMCGSDDYVRTGVAIGIGSSGGRPSLLINLPAARASGADLPAALLSVATVIQ